MGGRVEMVGWKRLIEVVFFVCYLGVLALLGWFGLV